MNKEELYKTLSSIYNNPISELSAWEVFNNFLELFMSEDYHTVDYLCRVIELSVLERLSFRNELAELGFELTPNELNQYILLMIIALNEYVEETQEGKL